MNKYSLTLIWIPSFVVFYWIVYRTVTVKWQNALLLVASYFFYAWIDHRFLILLLSSTLITFIVALKIQNCRLYASEINKIAIWNTIGLSTIILFNLDFYTIVININHLLFYNFYPTICFIFIWLMVLIKINTNNDNKIDKNRKLWLFLGIIYNLLILGYFKYYNFFIDNIDSLLKLVGIDMHFKNYSILLPIGVSFYSFKNISYLIDVYRGEVQAVRNYMIYSLFIAFFASLLAGPIDRARELISQLEIRRNWKPEIFLMGVHLIVIGLLKKMVIADGIVTTVNYVFDSKGGITGLDVLLGIFLYTIQIYCDFSGYTDIARGTAKLFGINLMENFKFPYFSKSLREFWQRWHISLSTWLRDYLYIAMGGNRRGQKKTIKNLIVTMLLGGLWHGAAWNFVLWGLYHGIFLSISRLRKNFLYKSNKNNKTYTKVFRILSCFVLVCFGWMLFRCESIESIIALVTVMISDIWPFQITATKPRFAAMIGIIILILIEIIEYIGKDRPFFQILPLPAYSAIYSLSLFAIILGITTESAQFVYFNF